MIGLYVSVPIACWRKGAAREYLETEPLPPPSTCYGMLLSYVGEYDRHAHLDCRVTVGVMGSPTQSTVLRTVWRVKNKKSSPGVGENARPDFQELWCGSELVVWLDSSDETSTTTLEQRVRAVLKRPETSERAGALCLGESTHLVDEIRLLRETDLARSPRTFLAAQNGRFSLTTWVDHVGTMGTRRCRGDLVASTDPPDILQLPQIQP